MLVADLALAKIHLVVIVAEDEVDDMIAASFVTIVVGEAAVDVIVFEFVIVFVAQFRARTHTDAVI